MDRILKEVTIELIQQCSSNCIFCSSNSNNNSDNEIPIEKVYEVLDFCKAKGAKVINFSGGEPLLYSDLIKVIEYCSSIDLNVVIYTSGNVNSTIISLILENSVIFKKVKFIFNYTSVDNLIYQKLINTENFSIEKLNFFIKSLLKQNISVEAHIVPNKINISTLYSTAEYLKSIKVPKVSFLRLVKQGRAETNQDKLFVENHLLNNEIGRIKNELSDYHFIIRGGVPFSNLLKYKCECFAGISKLIFRYDGIVFPCEAFKEAPTNQNYILGSIYNNSLESIWNNHPVHNKLSLLKDSSNSIGEPCPAQILYS